MSFLQNKFLPWPPPFLFYMGKINIGSKILGDGADSNKNEK